MDRLRRLWMAQDTLIQFDLAHFLEELDVPRIRLEPATVWHRRLNREYTEYVTLLVEQFFDSTMLIDLDLSGYKLYSYCDTYLFASPMLKDKLEASPFGYLRFSEGFSRFAAETSLD
jgi:hypothetical protein